MRASSYWYLANFWIKTVLLKKKDPIVGSIIITDRCNLRCKHCSVNNITEIVYPFTQIKKDMQTLYDLGVRILFLYGGEPFLWKDNNLTVRDLVVEAKKMGFMIVNVVTNGTFPINLPEADLILVSLDGDKERHNAIRGNTYDTIFEFWLAQKLGFLTKENNIYSMTAKGAFYYHYYEQFYTLSYIDKMWGIMRNEAFPKYIKM